MFTTFISYDLKKFSIKSLKNNMSKGECRALKILVSEIDFLISKVDEGGTGPAYWLLLLRRPELGLMLSPSPLCEQVIYSHQDFSRGETWQATGYTYMYIYRK